MVHHLIFSENLRAYRLQQECMKVNSEVGAVEMFQNTMWGNNPTHYWSMINSLSLLTGYTSCWLSPTMHCILVTWHCTVLWRLNTTNGPLEMFLHIISTTHTSSCAQVSILYLTFGNTGTARSCVSLSWTVFQWQLIRANFMYNKKKIQIIITIITKKIMLTALFRTRPDLKSQTKFSCISRSQVHVRSSLHGSKTVPQVADQRSPLTSVDHVLLEKAARMWHA